MRERLVRFVASGVFVFHCHAGKAQLRLSYNLRATRKCPKRTLSFASEVFGYAVNKKDNPNERFMGKTGYGVFNRLVREFKKIVLEEMRKAPYIGTNAPTRSGGRCRPIIRCSQMTPRGNDGV
jgi:hypothetical protein